MNLYYAATLTFIFTSLLLRLIVGQNENHLEEKLSVRTFMDARQALYMPMDLGPPLRHSISKRLNCFTSAALHRCNLHMLIFSTVCQLKM